MFSLKVLLVLIPSLPLAAALVTAALGPRVLRTASHWPVVLAVAGSLLASLALVRQVGGMSGPHRAEVYSLWQWADVADAQVAPPYMLAVAGSPRPERVDFSVGVTLRADALTAIMLVTVTFVSLLVVIYSIGYMHHDPGYARFFAFLGLFVFSMTMLVSVSNFVMLYVFWEAVGVCSYLLIGFWYQKPSAAAAGKKAFLVNRVGDFGFALGLFLLWTTYGTLNFHDAGGLAGVLGQTRLATDSTAAFAEGGVGLAIALLLLLGACGKSAQFPLHVWLPDAMEGPTPVSALIHAATMVTAGVYMVVRCTPLFMASVEAQQIVAFVGAFTALLAGLIALTQTDLKRVLAYSTVSQLGYMFLALGTGSTIGITAGMFHLFTHAFFKALLFLGSGSVMHAMGNVIDMRHFGGLRKLMPITFATFLIGCLALAGFPFLSGFWSKDMILAAVHERAEHVGRGDFLPGGVSLFTVLYWSATVTAFLTAFYTFRAFFMTFYGELRVPPEAGDHAHESPLVMTLPLVVLSVFALGIGWIMEKTHWFAEFLLTTPSLRVGDLGDPAEITFHPQIAIVSSVVALAAIGLAAFFYLGDRSRAEQIARGLGPFYQASRAKFLIDEMYSWLVVWPLRGLAYICYLLDQYLIDGIVNLIGRVPPLIGSGLRRTQRGMLQSYALAMIVGLVILAALLAFLPNFSAGDNTAEPAETPAVEREASVR